MESRNVNVISGGGKRKEIVWGCVSVPCHFDEWFSFCRACVFFVCVLHSLSFFFLQRKEIRLHIWCFSSPVLTTTFSLYSSFPRTHPDARHLFRRRTFCSFLVIFVFFSSAEYALVTSITMCDTTSVSTRSEFEITSPFSPSALSSPPVFPVPTPFPLYCPSVFASLYKVFQIYHLYIMMYGYDNVLYYGKMRKIYFCYWFVS